MPVRSGPSCSRCRQESPPSARFCIGCGARLASTCAGCGADLPDGARFCPGCGRAIESADAPAAPVARTEPEAYTPRHLAEKILTSRSAMQGERKPVTVLFCDLVSSTALAERLGADGMHGLLSRFFEQALAEVHRYEGTVNQFLGDGFMALFGAPIAHEDHARRAVLAALDIRRAVGERPLALPSGEAVQLTLRMGLHTGVVVVGAIGDNLRMDYTAVGDTSHLAARLQQAAEPGGILLSAATARLVEGYALLEPRGPMTIRGRTETLVVHALIGRGTRRSALDPGAGRVLSRFVGRERELATLGDALAQVAAGHGQAVGVVGEPGAGKSRLALELRRTLADRGVTLLEGRCLSYGGAIPYVPVLDLVRAACGIGDTDTPEQVTARVDAALAALGLGARDRAGYLLHLLGIKDPESRLAALSAEQIMAQTFDTLRELLLAMGRRGPVVILVEDLHWVDRTSEAFLASLVERLSGAAILLLATYRPGYRPPWLDRSYATQIALRPLGPQESLALVSGLLPEVAGADPIARLILDKAEGNPFFLEELARVVGDHRAGSGGLEVPDTVHGVLTARIDRLAEVPKRVLQTGSVLGREFSLRLLQAVEEESGARDLGPHMAELSRLEFLYERTEGGEPVYVFKHALTQDVARATLVAPRRRALHRRAAEALEAMYPERGRELAPLLAYHYEEAEAWGQAFQHALVAAESARQAFANQEALVRFDQALAAAGRAGREGPDTLTVLEARAQVHALLGDFERARADLERALAQAEARQDPAARGRVLGALGALWGGHRDYARGLTLLREAVTALEASGDRRALADARGQLGIMLLNVARGAESGVELEAARSLFEELGDERGQARALDMLGMRAALIGDFEGGVAHSEEAVRRLHAVEDLVTESSALINLSFGHGYRDGWRAGEPYVRRALELATTSGARAAEAFARAALAQIAVPCGRYGLARREAEAALAIASEIDHREWTAMALSMLGRTRLGLGDAAGALRLHEEMREIAERLGTNVWLSEARTNLGEDLIALGRLEEADALLASSVAHAGDLVLYLVQPLSLRAGLLLRRGDPAAALAMARDAATRAPWIRVFAGEARRVEAEALAAIEGPAAALPLLAEVEALAGGLDAAPLAWRSALASARLLRALGRSDEGRAAAARALAVLETVARELDGAERAIFEASEPMVRARAWVG
ncbi:MAG TPA: AAA family ATPase [Pseudomonadales bacterium]|nr:AAA family ATPase [Pseudomonadales bacterium]